MCQHNALTHNKRHSPTRSYKLLFIFSSHIKHQHHHHVRSTSTSAFQTLHILLIWTKSDSQPVNPASRTTMKPTHRYAIRSHGHFFWCTDLDYQAAHPGGACASILCYMYTPQHAHKLRIPTIQPYPCPHASIKRIFHEEYITNTSNTYLV